MQWHVWPEGIYGYSLQAKEAGQLGAEQQGCGNTAPGWTTIRNERVRELLIASTRDHQFLSEMGKVKQHSPVTKRSKRAALNSPFTQCCRDWLCAEGKIVSKLSHAAEQLREKCWSAQGLSELTCYSYSILKAAEDCNLRVQPKCYKCIFFAAKCSAVTWCRCVPTGDLNLFQASCSSQSQVPGAVLSLLLSPKPVEWYPPQKMQLISAVHH